MSEPSGRTKKKGGRSKKSLDVDGEFIIDSNGSNTKLFTKHFSRMLSVNNYPALADAHYNIPVQPELIQELKMRMQVAREVERIQARLVKEHKMKAALSTNSGQTTVPVFSAKQPTNKVLFNTPDATSKAGGASTTVPEVKSSGSESTDTTTTTSTSTTTTTSASVLVLPTPAALQPKVKQATTSPVSAARKMNILNSQRKVEQLTDLEQIIKRNANRHMAFMQSNNVEDADENSFIAEIAKEETFYLSPYTGSPRRHADEPMQFQDKALWLGPDDTTMNWFLIESDEMHTFRGKAFEYIKRSAKNLPKYILEGIEHGNIYLALKGITIHYGKLGRANAVQEIKKAYDALTMTKEETWVAFTTRWANLGTRRKAIDLHMDADILYEHLIRALGHNNGARTHFQFVLTSETQIAEKKDCARLIEAMNAGMKQSEKNHDYRKQHFQSNPSAGSGKKKQVMSNAEIKELIRVQINFSKEGKPISICWNEAEHGTCKYGKKCKFTHTGKKLSANELQQIKDAQYELKKKRQEERKSKNIQEAVLALKETLKESLTAAHGKANSDVDEVALMIKTMATQNGTTVEEALAMASAKLISEK